MESVGLVLAALATWIVIHLVIRRKQRSFEDQGFSGKPDGSLDFTNPKLSVSRSWQR